MTEATVSSVTTTSRRVPGGRAKAHRHGLAGFLFTLPFMVLFLAFFIAPLIYAAYLSLYRKQLIGGNSFVGLQNYADGLRDSAFLHGIGRVALYMVVQVPVMLALALVFALILDSGRTWLGKVFRVKLKVDGKDLKLKDTSQILNTGGIDPGGCPVLIDDEFHPWMVVFTPSP